MATLAGTPIFPESMTIPDDGPDMTATTVNVAFEALADRSAYLFRSLVMGIVKFSPMVDNADASTTVRDGRPGYCRKRMRWFFGVGQARVVISDDYLASSVRTTTAVQGGGYHWAFVNNPASPRYGNGIAVPQTNNTDTYQYLDATQTYPVAAALPSIGWNGVIYDPFLDLYIANKVGTLCTSPTSAIAWTTRTLTGGAMSYIPAVTNGAGVLLVHGKTKGVYYSTDGVTWTEATTAFGLVGISGMCWDAHRGRFVVALTDTAGLSETWTSADGATWSLLASNIPLNLIAEIVSVGPVLVAQHLAGTLDLAGDPERYRLVYSMDGGATWGRSPSPVWGPIDTAAFLTSNGSDICAVNLGTNYRHVSFSRGWLPMAL